MPSSQSLTPLRPPAPAAAPAFTLVELLVVVSVLGLLSALWMPALAAARTKGHDLVCENNLRQLIGAWQLYANENRDRLVMNFHGGDAQGGAAASQPHLAPWALGWLDWSTSRDNTNVSFLTQDRYSRLAQYLRHSKGPFKCPSDQFLSSSQRARGWTERVRSVSLNLGVGDGNAETGPWDPIYKHIRKTSEFLYPGPNETYVFLDEHPDSINDPGFFNPYQTAWLDQPASYHNGAAAFAFADGHTELHKWRGSVAQQAALRVNYANTVTARGYAGDPDIHWVSYRAGRISERSY